MTTKRIVFTRPDGGVSVFHPAPAFMARFPDEASGLEAAQARAIPPDATKIAVIEAGDLPPRSDATNDLRAGWEWDDTAKRITINPDKTAPLPERIG